MKTVRNQGRQGDVLLTRIDTIPRLCAELPPSDDRIVLAFGEATGHAHAIPSANARLFDYYGRTYVEIVGTDPQPLIHEEHETLLLEPGFYSVRIQRQHFNDANRWLDAYGND